MKPILFTDELYDSAPNSHGIGVLSDAVSCLVTEELNGDYTLKMSYPITGSWYNQIGLRSIIVAKSNKADVPQPFRVYRIVKPISGLVTIYANHISSDFSGIPISPFSGGTPQTSINAISQFANILVPHKFTLSQDVGESSGVMSIDTPRSAKQCLVGSQNSFVDTFGGEIKYDRYSIHITKKRGEDKGVRISYGKNLTSLSSDADVTEFYTGIYPYAINDEGSGSTSIITVNGYIVNADGADSVGFRKIKVVDLTDKFISADGTRKNITSDSLYAEAVKYIKNNDILAPKHNLKVSFVPLSDTIEFEGKELIEGVDLGDTVAVSYEGLGVTTKARCIKTVFNTLSEKYETVEIGNPKESIIDTIATLVTKTKRL